MRVERLRKEFDIEVEWKGLEIHPELPLGGVPREGLFRGEYFKQAEASMHRLAADAGLTMTSPSIISNSHLALEAAEFARECGTASSFRRRLFEAYFQEGANIGDRDVLVGLADEMGLDGEKLRQALEERRYQGLLAGVKDETQRLGISGVPTFLIGNQRVVGAQPYEVLRQAAIRAGARPLQHGEEGHE
ncbi:MAG: DsbA family protein [Chloroflexi bacterium]|nr:DsbA family protein [Chloroflexota bacterium]